MYAKQTSSAGSCDALLSTTGAPLFSESRADLSFLAGSLFSLPRRYFRLLVHSVEEATLSLPAGLLLRPLLGDDSLLSVGGVALVLLFFLLRLV